MKFSNKTRYIINLIIAIVLICYMCLAPMTIFPLIYATQNKINKNEQPSFTGILELWNVDTFEGGSISRAYWLEDVAVKFEKENKGVFVAVQNMTIEQLQLNLENENLPDLISFGLGAGELIVNKLTNLNSEFNVRQDIINAGKINGKLLAVPYLMGGYSLINSVNESKNLIGLGLNSNTCPLVSALFNNLSGYTFLSNANELTSFDAYDGYIKNKFNLLLGTQRDLYRVNNRVGKSMMTEQFYSTLNGFSDLIQYVGITKKGNEKNSVCFKFVEKLLSNEMQESLRDINMFNVKKLNIYSAEPFLSMENILNSNLHTLNVFLEKSTINDINKLCLDFVKGNDSVKNSINKYVI